MKNGTFICCILLCGFLSLIACSKNNDNSSPVTPPTDTTTTPNPDSTNTGGGPKYQVGDTLILRGDTSNNDETALISSKGADLNTPDFPNFVAIGKDFGGATGKYRSAMKFRIRNLDDSSRDNPPPVKKAVLYLYQYHMPTDIDIYTIPQDSNNAVELHRIIGDWRDSTITWNSQPNLANGSTNSLEDFVTIPAIATPLPSGTKDEQEIDITDMMRKIFESRSNKGFMLKLANENGQVGRSFGSFACPNNKKRPKLVIYF